MDNSEYGWGQLIHKSCIQHCLCLSLLSKGGLTITLEEADGSLAYNTLVQITNLTQTRRINLVPGRGYLLHCQSETGARAGAGAGAGGSHTILTAIWYAGDREVTTGSRSDPNRPSMYSYLEANRRTLVMANFSLSDVGVYRCRERGSSNTDGAGVVLGAGMRKYNYN